MYILGQLLLLLNKKIVYAAFIVLTVLNHFKNAVIENLVQLFQTYQQDVFENLCASVELHVCDKDVMLGNVHKGFDLN